MPSGSQVITGSLPRPPGTARGPYTGFAASNFAFPHAVIGGVSLLIVRTPRCRAHTPDKSRGSCGTDGGGGVVLAGAAPRRPWPRTGGAASVTARRTRLRTEKRARIDASSPLGDGVRRSITGEHLFPVDEN